MSDQYQTNCFRMDVFYTLFQNETSFRRRNLIYRGTHASNKGITRSKCLFLRKNLSFCPIFTGHALTFIEGSTTTNASFRTNSQNCHRMDHIVCFWANGYYQRNNPIHHCFISGRCIFLKKRNTIRYWFPLEKVCL